MAIAKALTLSVTRSLVAFQAKPLRLLKTCSVLIGFWIAPGAIASTQSIAPAVPEHSFSQRQPHTQQIVQSASHNPPAVASFVLFESGVSPGWWDDRQNILVSPSGRYITALTSTSNWVGDRPVKVRATRIWDIENDREVSRLFQVEQFIPQYLSPNGRYLFTTGEDYETIQIWDIEENREAFSLQDRFCDEAGFSADSQYFVSLRLLEDVDDGEISSEIRIWDFVGNQQIASVVLSESQSINCGRHSTGKFHVSPNSQYIALEISDYGSSNHALIESITVMIWDLESNQEVVRIQNNADDIFEKGFADISFSPNSRYVGTAARDGTLQVWDLETKEEVIHEIHPEKFYGELGVRNISFSPDSRYILGRSGRALLAWDIETDHELIKLSSQEAEYFLNGQFSEDSQNLVIHRIRYSNEYDEARVFSSTWNIEISQRIAHIEGSRINGYMHVFQPSSDGRYISAMSRRSAAILDAVTLESLFTFQIDPVSVDEGFRDFFYSFDSQYLLTTKFICNSDLCLDDYGVEDYSTVGVVQLWELP